MTYLLLNVATVFFPFALSFDKKVAFWRSWRYVLPAQAATGFVFIAWDIAFTKLGVWGFNPAHVMGIYAAGLPWEEWAFFLTVPYACVFVYACLQAYIPALRRHAQWEKYAYRLSWAIVALMLVMGVLYFDRWYTSVTAFALAAWLVLNLLVIKPKYLGSFYLSYLVCLLPFGIVNGILTALPVVWYNNAENLALRIGTIPIEDTAYNMLMLLMTINFFEWGRSPAAVRGTR